MMVTTTSTHFTIMVQALTILTALQMFSEGGVEATSEPYGISRDVVAGAALAGASFTPPPSGRDLDARPVPALSQVTPTLSPDGPSSGLEPPGPNPNDGRRPFPDTPDPSTNEISGKNRMNIPLVPEKTACDGGQGEMRFEKLPDVRLAPNSYDSDVIRKNAMPAAVLALCEDRCLKDRTATQQLTRRCGSLDFVPGRRYSSYSNSVEYTETKCFLSQPQDDRNSAGANSRSQYERASNYAHLREVCFSTGASSSTKESILRQECPDRLYVMERLLAKRFTPKNVIEVTASTLEECQNICLHQLSEDPQNETTICRSGTWDRGRNRCFISSYTRRTHPAEFVDDPDMDYFENTCLSAERRCPKDRLFYLKEINAEMGGPFDPVTIVNVTLQQCKEKCIESKTIFCRSMEYDQRSKLCVLSDEDSVSRREELRASTSSDNVYFELKCFDGDRIGGEYLMEEDIPLTSPNTEPLNARAFRDVRTAFQLYRNRHLELRSGFRNDRRERNLLTLAECLDECLEERRFACRSVMYSERFQICKLSEFDQYNGELIYDGEYDYFENLMGAGSSGVSTSGTGSSGSGSSSSGSSGFSSSFGSTSFGSSSGSSGSGSSGSSSSGGSSGSFGFSDNRNSVGIGLSGDSFDTREGSGFSSSSSVASTSRTGTRPNRPSLFDDRPGLFRPISTDFGDDSRTSNNRNTGVFGITRGETDGGSSIRGGSSGTSNRFDSSSRFGSSSSSSASSSSDSFGSSADRFGSGSDRVAGGADRFGSGSDRFGSSSDRFGSGSNRFGSSSDRVAGGSDRFGAGSDRFGSSSNSLSGSDSDRTATGLDRFAGTDRFSSAGGGSSASSGLGSSAFGAGRFSGSGSSSDSSTGLFWTGRRGGSTRFDSDRGAASLGADAGSSGLSTSRLGTMNGEVAQSCNEDGSMEFTLRTDEPFRGRIYAYGYYDRCFFVGRGSTVSVLQLSSPRGFPDCGTLRYADTLTNIVVVQFAENVQTMMDKRYNLTCTTIGPSDSVVTSAYIGAGYGTAVAGATSSAGAPTPIEYLELENRLDQRVALRVLYDGRPTTTIAVGDPLTFKLEPQAGFNLVSDIFATNVVAKDPYSGRAVQLIDSRGCPVDNYIFPALGRARSGEGLETRFSAFKIPESNFLVFEANVRPCKNACTPAFCRDTHGRGEIESYGRRRRRDLEERLGPVNETSYTNMTSEEQWLLEQEKLEAEEGPMEHVHGIYEVYLSREDIPRAEELMHLLDVCLSPAAYHGLLAITVSSVLGLILVLAATYLFYRRHLRYGLAAKNAMADAANPRHVSLRHEAARGSFPSHPRTVPQPARYFPDPSPSDISFSKPETERRNSCFADPSEPICPNPALFERLPSTGTEPTQQV